MQRYSVQDFERDFPNDAACLEWLRNSLYPNGIFCKLCKKTTRHHRVQTRHSYSCDRCGHHVHPTAGTIFAKSRTGLRHWFRAIYWMASMRSGISARRIQKETGVTYKTAWRMLRQIRSLLAEGVPAPGRIRKSDHDSGGKKSRRDRTASSRPVITRTAPPRGHIRVIQAPRGVKSRLSPSDARRVLPVSLILKKRAASSSKAPAVGCLHRRIHRSIEVRIANAHPRSVRRFWRRLRSGIRGVYRAVSAKYLQSYLNEYSFRFNYRGEHRPMFAAFLCRLSSSR